VACGKKTQKGGGETCGKERISPREPRGKKGNVTLSGTVKKNTFAKRKTSYGQKPGESKSKASGGDREQTWGGEREMYPGRHRRPTGTLIDEEV